MTITFSPVTALPQLYLDTSWTSPSSALVAVGGEVDLATAHVLRERLLGVVREHAPAVLEVDLAAVTFLDCIGISVLVAVRNTATQVGCQMRIVRPQPIVRRVLDVTGLLDVFTAPIDQPQPLPIGPGHRLWTGSASASDPPATMAAA
jgi:anti-anti-sigma factor